MSLRFKLNFSFLGIILLSLMVGLVGLLSIANIRQSVLSVTEDLFPASLESKELEVLVRKIGGDFATLLNVAEFEEAKQIKDNITTSLKQIEKIAGSLEKKFRGQDEVLGRIKELKESIRGIYDEREVVYNNIRSVITLKNQNVRLNRQINSLLGGTTAIISGQVDNIEFDMILAEEETKNRVNEAADAIQTIASNYEGLAGRYFPGIRMILSLRVGFEEANKFLERIIRSESMDGVNIYEDKFVAAYTHAKERLSSLKDETDIEEDVIAKLNQSMNNYEALVLGKEGVINTVKTLLGGNSMTYSQLKEQLSSLSAQLAPIEGEIVSITAEVIDAYEFEVFLGTDSANQAIATGKEGSSKLKAEVGLFLEEMFPLVKGWLSVKGGINACSAIVVQILGEEDLDVLPTHDDNFRATFSAVNQEVDRLKGIFKGTEIEKISSSLGEIQNIVVDNGGILESRENLLVNLKESQRIAVEVSGNIKEVTEMVSKTISDIEEQTSEASESAQSVVTTSRGIIGVVSLVVIIVGLFIGGVLATFIVRNINIVAKSIESLSGRKGDLTARVAIKSKDEIGLLGDSFNRLLESFGGMVKVIKDTASKVNTSAQNLSSSSQQVNATTQQISASVQQVSEGASTQVAKVEETSRIIKELVNSLEKIANNADNVAKTSVEVTERAQTGGEGINELGEKINIVSNIVDDSAKTIEALGSRSEEIGDITSTITAIADQTNLLSLNAAIEAARAGDAGRGFAVVAEEIRKLAENSSQAATQIGNLVKNVQSEVNDTVKLITTGKVETEVIRKLAEKVSILEEEIVHSSQVAEGMTKEVSGLIPEQIKGAERASHAITEVTTIAQQTASTSEEVSASIEEMSASIEEVVSAASELVSMASKLTELVGQFKLKEDVDSHTTKQDK